MSVTGVQLVDSCCWLQNVHSTLAANIVKEEAVLIPPTGPGFGAVTTARRTLSTGYAVYCVTWSAQEVCLSGNSLW